MIDWFNCITHVSQISFSPAVFFIEAISAVPTGCKRPLMALPILCTSPDWTRLIQRILATYCTANAKYIKMYVYHHWSLLCPLAPHRFPSTVNLYFIKQIGLHLCLEHNMLMENLSLDKRPTRWTLRSPNCVTESVVVTRWSPCKLKTHYVNANMFAR